MKLIPLSGGNGVGKFAQVDDEDFEFLSGYSWWVQKGGHTFYAVSYIKNNFGYLQQTLMHRYILGVYDPKIFVDHENGDGLCNIRRNIRKCSHSQNMQNRRIGKNNTSGITGVSWDKKRKKWRATIVLNNKKHHLGSFEHKKDAGSAYDTKAKELFGEFHRKQ